MIVQAESRGKLFDHAEAPLSKRRFILRKYNVFFQTFLFTFDVGAVTALSDKRKILPDRSDLRNFPTFSYLRLRRKYSRSAMFK